MTRAGATWRTYVYLLAQVAAHYEGTLVVNPNPQGREDELLDRFTTALSAKDAAALAILERVRLSEGHFRTHLRYIARWGIRRRQLLADGANFQLLEGLTLEEQAGQLEGLRLSGTLVEQRRALSGHLKSLKAMPQGLGWLAPSPKVGRGARLYDARDVAWVYSRQEVEFSEGLHPSVARSLIARYVPEAGVVADPMAGGGVVPVIATELGHQAWASDIAPAQPFIRQLDLRETDLGEVFGDDHRVAADLLVLHPPLPATLGLSDCGYTDWLEDVLDHCWGGVRVGGCLALIVPVSATVPVLSRAERALRRSAAEFFNDDVEDLSASHLAVSRDGKEGWHILVLRTPAVQEAHSE